jgi:hypothetical protein
MELAAARSTYDAIVVANLGRVPLSQQHGDLWLESLHGVANPEATNHRFLSVIMLADRIHFMLAMRDRDVALRLQEAFLVHLQEAIAAPVAGRREAGHVLEIMS